ncbi:hypothetical protein FOG50_01306 [Hanseniaspora uvarum]|nr:hypothetical protein FOG48_03327 [Hanseniaspora uvarum]KAF0277843.1 hypothetical protein FOG50_01306 [Hanseniaspora uvarum]
MSSTIKSIKFQEIEKQVFYISKIKCASCHEVDDSKSHAVNMYDSVQDDKGTEFNFIMKCKYCSNKMTLNIQSIDEVLINKKFEATQDYEEDFVEKALADKKKSRNSAGIKNIDRDETANDGAILLMMDCRGSIIEEISYDDGNVFTADIAGNHTMTDLALEDMELYDYDQDNDTDLSVTEVVWTIIKK